MSDARAYDYGYGASAPTGVNPHSFSNTLNSNSFTNSFTPSFKSSSTGSKPPQAKLSGTWTPGSYRA